MMPPPAMAGTARRNENLAASMPLRPRPKPAVIVIPDREMPGTRAVACAAPTSTGPAGNESRDHQHGSGDQQGDCDRRGRLLESGELIGESNPDGGGDGADDQQPQDVARLGIPTKLDQLDQVVPVVREHRHQGAEMEECGGRQVGGFDTQEGGYENEVSGRGNR
jgi:hypothetical protein